MPITGLVYGAKVTSGYEVANSLRFDDGSSDYLNRTGTTATDGKKFTLSLWFKRANLGNSKELFCIYLNNTHRMFFRNNGDTFELQIQSKSYNITGTREFRDTSAWSHFVVTADSTEATDSDRIKWYVNGERQNLTAGSSFPALNDVFPHGQGSANYYIGNGEYNSSPYTNYWDGYICEAVFIDGTAYDETSFGEFDSDTNIWKPIDVSGLTFGTNGFYLDFENSGSLGADVSGNGNNFTVNNLTSIDQSTDTCTNNFATLNPLNNNTSATSTFSEGNLKLATDGFARSSIAVSSGKWYCEIKCVSNTAWNGVTDVSQYINNEYTTNSVALYTAGATLYIDGSNQGSGGYGSAWSANDIMNLALDLDSGTKKLYFGKNGGWWNGSTYGASSPSTGVTLTNDVTYAITVGSGSGTSTNEANFGNPPFTISSGNSDGNGYGNFEYSVPSGYYALNSKNLAEYG